MKLFLGKWILCGLRIISIEQIPCYRRALHQSSWRSLGIYTEILRKPFFYRSFLIKISFCCPFCVFSSYHLYTKLLNLLYHQLNAALTYFSSVSMYFQFRIFVYKKKNKPTTEYSYQVQRSLESLLNNFLQICSCQ